MGSVLLPGTAFLELALHAGDQLGSPVVEELILEAPLVPSEQSAVQLQVSVGELDEGGRRPIGIYSRLQPPGDELQSERREWTRHASGLLVSDHAAVGERALRERTSALVGGAWPPEGSEAVEIDGMYDRMAGLGLDYGPVFQGLRAAWSRDDEIFAEVVLPAQEHEQAALFGVHPALLDAALQIMGLSPGGGAAGEPHGEGRRLQNGRVPLPFSFGDVQLHASGSSSLRVSLSLSGEYASSLVMADEAGGLVASVGSLVLREVSAEQLGSARGKHRDSLFRIDWTGVLVPQEPSVGEMVLLGDEGSVLEESLGEAGCSVEVFADLGMLGDALDGGRAFPGVVVVDCDVDGVGVGVDGGPGSARECAGHGGLVLAHGSVQRVLSLVQAWLSDERFAASRLVLLTRDAVAVRGEGLLGLFSLRCGVLCVALSLRIRAVRAG